MAWMSVHGTTSGPQTAMVVCPHPRQRAAFEQQAVRALHFRFAAAQEGRRE